MTYEQELARLLTPPRPPLADRTEYQRSTDDMLDSLRVRLAATVAARHP